MNTPLPTTPVERRVVRAQQRVVNGEIRWHELRATRDETFRLAHLAGMPAAHIAALTGLSVSRVHMILKLPEGTP